MKIFTLTLICLSLSGVYSDSHSLCYYYTAVSAPESGLPEFSTVVYVDDQQIESYSSDIGRSEPVAHWIKKNERPEYWERRTWYNKEHATLFKREMKLWKKKFNHNEGFHYLQVTTNCELRDDGSTISYKQFRYDGEEFMYYNTPTGTFISTWADAQTITQRWNAQDIGIGKTTKFCLEIECIESLKRFIDYGREDLEKRVRPKLKVTHQKSGEVTKLHCLVYGFYPRAVDVRWMKNGVDEVPSHETTDVLPNPDGTYQIRVTVEVITKEGDSYSCYVDHTSLEEPLHMEWGLKPDSPQAVIIGAVVIILVVLTSGTAGVLIYRRKKEKYKEVRVFESSSDSDKPVAS